jgi:hypothetical protein
MRDARYALSKEGTNPLNTQFYRVDSVYKAVLKMLKEKGSPLVDTPIYIWVILMNWLKTQGSTGENYHHLITKALNHLVVNPAEVFPPGARLSEKEWDLVKTQGSGYCTEKTYLLIIDQLKLRASRDEFRVEFKNIRQAQGGDSSAGWVQVATKGVKKVRSANSVITEASTLTLNTTTTEARKPTYTPCSTCGLFHMNPKCDFFDKKTNSFNTKKFLDYRTVRVIDPTTGMSSISPHWLRKLTKFGFPAMGISAEKDQKKIIQELEKAAKALPKATKEEVERRAVNAPKWVNLSIQEESYDASGARGELKALVNMAKSYSTSNSTSSSSKTKTEKSKSKAEKRKRKEVRQSEEEDSDSEDESDTESEISEGK